MKQVKQIIEFILIVASCFFRKRKQQESHPLVPEDPYPPGPCAARKGDCPCSPGCNCNIDPAPAPGKPGSSGQSGNSCHRENSYQSEPSSQPGDSGQYGKRYLPAVIPNEGADGPTPGPANLLGWCLIAVAGTSYLYKLLA